MARAHSERSRFRLASIGGNDCRSDQPVGTRRASIRCSAVSQAAPHHAPIRKLGSKLALLTAAGAGLYLSSHYTDGRKVSNWTAAVASSSPPANGKREPARDTNRSRQRLMAEPNSCDSQTWPHISPECIASSRACQSRRESALVAEQPSSILLRPTKLPEAVPDPEVTGALLLGEQQLKVRDGEPAVGTVKTGR